MNTKSNAVIERVENCKRVNCVVCRRVFEVFAGSLEPDEDYFCDTCYDFLNNEAAERRKISRK